MKMTIAIFILVCSSAFIFSEWTNSTAGTVTESSVLRDETDKQLSEVSPDAIYKQFGLFGENAKWNGAIFRYSTISDVSFNKVTEARILPENPWLDNEIDRTAQIENFRNEVFKPFVTVADTGTKKHSSVYLPIARELKRLSESKSQVRRLFIYSDLMENRPDLSLYDLSQFALLTSHPEYTVKKFNEWMPLPSLTGIEVHLIYQPANIEDDKNFVIVSEFYGKLLESKGAKVFVEANLQN